MILMLIIILSKKIKLDFKLQLTMTYSKFIRSIICRKNIKKISICCFMTSIVDHNRIE